MRHSWAILNMVLKVSIASFLKVFIPSFDSMPRFPKLVRSLSANSALFFALSLWPLIGIFWSTQFHSIYNGSDSPPGFLNTSLDFSIFSLCVKWNTLYIEREREIEIDRYMLNFCKSSFLALEFPRGVTQFVQNCQL